MDIWDEMYAAAKELYRPEAISPFIDARHVVAAVQSESGKIFTGFIHFRSLYFLFFVSHSTILAHYNTCVKMVELKILPIVINHRQYIKYILNSKNVRN